MSEQKHTPGPWFVGSKFVVGPRDDSNTQTRGLVVGVADVYGENKEQDARLIAAAPALLAALKALDERGHTQATWNLALKAIAKAEGRQP